MDDRIEQADGTPAITSSALGRREMLKRTGFVVGAAALWNTPFVKTIGISAAAATDTQIGRPLCVGDDGEFDCQGQKPAYVTFAWNRFALDDLPDPFYEKGDPLRVDNCPQQLTNSGYVKALIAYVEAWDGTWTQQGGAGNLLGTFSVPEDMTINTFEVPTAKGFINLDFKNASGERVYAIDIHISCSQYLACGDRFGWVTVVGGMNADNELIDCKEFAL